MMPSRRKLDQIRREVRGSDDRRMRLRRTVVGLSLASGAAMAAVTLLQGGLVRRLPDVPLPGFDSQKVNLSDDAWRLGLPDGAIGVVGAALNLPLALAGPVERPRWLPVLACAKAAADAAVSLGYLYLMPTREKAWCAYCVAGALLNCGILAATVPEAAEAWRGKPRLRSRPVTGGASSLS